MNTAITNQSETQVFEALGINPSEASAFTKTWILQAYTKENEPQLKSFFARKEHLKNLNALSKDEIKILNDLEPQDKFVFSENFDQFETLTSPFITAIVMIGYEMRCLDCGEFHQNNKAIGFVLPIEEIYLAQEMDKSQDEIDALIPDIVCPACKGKNNMHYFLDLIF